MKRILLFLIGFLGFLNLQAQAPLIPSVRCSLTTVTVFTDPYTVVGKTSDFSSNWDATSISAGDSLYLMDGNELRVYRVATISAASGVDFTMTIDDINNSGNIPVTGVYGAFYRGTTNYEYPNWVAGVSEQLNMAIQNRFVQRLDANMYAGMADYITTDSFTTFIGGHTFASIPINKEVWRTTTGSKFQKTSSTAMTRRSTDDGENARQGLVQSGATLAFNSNLFNKVRLSTGNISSATISNPTNYLSQEVGETFLIGVTAGNVPVALTWGSIYGTFNGSIFASMPSLVVPDQTTMYFKFRVVSPSSETIKFQYVDGINSGASSVTVVPDSAFVDVANPTVKEMQNWALTNNVKSGDVFQARPKRIEVGPSVDLINTNDYSGQVYMTTMPENSSNPGRIIMSYRKATGHTSGGQLRLRNSDDGGATWNNDRLYIAVSAPNHYAGMVVNAIGHDSIFATYQALNQLRTYWALSVDGGTTWQTATILPQLSNITAGPIVEGHSVCDFGANGTWVVPVTGDTTGVYGTFMKVGAYRTTNFGSTWTYHNIIPTSALHPNEHSFLVIRDSIVSYIRNNEAGNTVSRVASANGINWTAQVNVTPPNNVSGKPAPFLTSDGRVLLAGRLANAYSSSFNKRYTYICESYDYGFTWKNQYTINSQGYYYYGDIVENAPGDFLYVGGVDTLYPSFSRIVNIRLRDPDPLTLSLRSDTSFVQISGQSEARIEKLNTVGNGLNISRYRRYELGGPTDSGQGSLLYDTEIPGAFKFSLRQATNLIVGYSVSQATTPTNMLGYELILAPGGIWTDFGGTSWRVGNQAGFALTTGQNNTFGGYRSGAAVIATASNTSFGSDAYRQGTGARNSAFGFSALSGTLQGDDNLGIGTNTLAGLTGFWYGNSGFGNFAGRNLATGSFNTVGGINNSFTGTSYSTRASWGADGYYFATGADLVGLGYRHGYYVTTGSELVLSGTRNGFGLRTAARVVNMGNSGQYATGGNDGAGLGHKNLFYNRAASNTAVGSETFNNFNDDVANTKSVSAITGQNWTSTGHGYTVGDLVGLKVSSTGTVPSGIANLTPYIFRVVDANTLTIEALTISGSGSGTITLIPNLQYSNSTAIGFDAEPDASNQVVLGNSSVTQLRARNYRFNIDQTVGAGQDNYVLTYDNVTGEIGLEAATATLDGFSADRTIAADWDGTLTDSANFANLIRIATNGGVALGTSAIPTANDFNVGVLDDINIIAGDDITLNAAQTGGTLSAFSNNTAQLNAPSWSLIGLTGGTQPTMEFNEDNDLGTDAVTIQAPNSLSGNFTQTFTPATGEIPVVLKGSATLDFSSTGPGTCNDLTIAVTGAADGDVVILGYPAASLPTTGTFTASGSAADTVTVRYCNNSTVLTQDPASGTFKVQVSK